MPSPKQGRVRGWHVSAVLVATIAVTCATMMVPLGPHVFLPDSAGKPGTGYRYTVPLDPESPWPKFRANALQNGRSPTQPVVDPTLRPWRFETGKGIFSSGVVDAEGTVYIGSADQYFYAINRDGELEWKFQTEEVIDSSALLDDRGRVCFGSGDAHVYCLDRNSGALLWKFKADSVEAVEARYDIESYNVDWFEGNIAMLEDGTLIAPNDNFLIYAIDRDSGQKQAEYLGNELMWSLPAVNTRTKRMFSGSQFMALRNVYAFDTEGRELAWTSGGWGSNAASPLLTSSEPNGALIIGGYDGYVRAYAQDSGKQLWRRGVHGHIYSSPAQLSDGTLIQPSTDGTVYALDPATGEVKWAFDTLGPIRSSPAIDARDQIYVGNGEGRLFAINPDGTLRWSYLCIDGQRNDLNSSPALGKSGVYIGGQDGGVFYVPYDYPMTDVGMRDPRSDLGPGEALPEDGVFLIYTAPFGGLLVDPPEFIAANQPLAFTLFVRENGDTPKAEIDRDQLEVSASGGPPMTLKVSADRQFFTMTPKESWVGPQGGTIRIDVAGSYRTDLWRFGLKFFGGSAAGPLDHSFSFRIAARTGESSPYVVPHGDGDPATTFEFSRFAAPNPTMLPSWNQIGFDSLHYLGGTVEGTADEAIVWVVAGKLQAGETVVDPSMEMRFPLVMEYDRGLLTFHNYDGFKINFVGSWDMPFGFYRASTRVDPESGRAVESAELSAIALCDEVEYYGRFLKLMGMSEMDTGHMTAFGGLDISTFGDGYASPPEGIGTVEFARTPSSVTATIVGGLLGKQEHVFSLLLIDAATARPVPLYYTKDTEVRTN
ncbi:MAG: PQQ-binding-like beta-propeller repeat protein, partial [bacterium]|nr:PQQ-binding-like beta-propeller repeat protein [bacterium]